MSKIIVVVGGSGCGKTDLCEHLIKNYFGEDKSELISEDWYYKEEQDDFDTPDALDLDLLADHLDKLKNGQPVEFMSYNMQNNKRDIPRKLSPDGLFLVEGLYALNISKIRQSADVSIFIDVDPDLRLARRISRDFEIRKSKLAENGVGYYIEYYFKYVKPSYDRDIEPERAYADIILNNNVKGIEHLLSAAEKELDKLNLK